jgi:hypothetical protein
MPRKEKISLTGLLLGMNHGYITSNPNQSMLQFNGNIPVHLVQPKIQDYTISWEGCAYHVLGFSGSTVS